MQKLGWGMAFSSVDYTTTRKNAGTGNLLSIFWDPIAK
jgi:hypothetical protein